MPFLLVAGRGRLLAVALARPVAVAAVPTNQTTVMLTIDVSGSMCSTDIPPTPHRGRGGGRIRLHHPPERVHADRHRGVLGVRGAGAGADHRPAKLLNALHSLATGRRTAIGSGLLAAIDAISSVDTAVAPSTPIGAQGPVPVAPGAYAPDIVVLLTDGASNTGPAPLDAAQEAADRGVRVYTIGFGTANGGRPRSAVRAASSWAASPTSSADSGRGGRQLRRGRRPGRLPARHRRGHPPSRSPSSRAASTTRPRARATSSRCSRACRCPSSSSTRRSRWAPGSRRLAGLLTALGLLLGRLWRPLP